MKICESAYADKEHSWFYLKPQVDHCKVKNEVITVNMCGGWEMNGV